jgi:FkbM family methyltransferase
MENYSVDDINKELKGWDGGDFYGQWQTDKIIESYFDKDYIGTCIEVGAADGVKGSNTYYFEKKGWKVLCIEPNPKYKNNIEKYRKLIRYFACGAESKKTEMTIFEVGEKNIMSSLSSISPDQRLVNDHINIINKSYKIEVQQSTLNNILENEVLDTEFEEIEEIDFISIDTEGTEIEVLKGIDFNKYKIKLLVVENNYNDSIIEDYLREFGYVKQERYKINDFYLKK